MRYVRTHLLSAEGHPFSSCLQMQRMHLASLHMKVLTSFTNTVTKAEFSPEGGGNCLSPQG